MRFSVSVPNAVFMVLTTERTGGCERRLHFNAASVIGSIDRVGITPQHSIGER
jgi:hypothetical protein